MREIPVYLCGSEPASFRILSEGEVLTSQMGWIGLHWDRTPIKRPNLGPPDPEPLYLHADEYLLLGFRLINEGGDLELAIGSSEHAGRTAVTAVLPLSLIHPDLRETFLRWAAHACYDHNVMLDGPPLHPQLIADRRWIQANNLGDGCEVATSTGVEAWLCHDNESGTGCGHYTIGDNLPDEATCVNCKKRLFEDD